MGWTPDQMSSMNVHDINLAWEGRIEMLQAMGLVKLASSPAVEQEKYTPQMFLASFGKKRRPRRRRVRK